MPSNVELWTLNPPQAIRSAEAAVNKYRPARVFGFLLYAPHFLPINGRNLDLGSGPWECATEVLWKTWGARNIRFDPWALPENDNLDAIKAARDGQCDTVTCANVLSVIAEREVRNLVIREAYNALKRNGTALFQIYEGSKTGKGRVTKQKQGRPLVWQENRRWSTYLPEIMDVFDHAAHIREGIISAWKE